MGFSPAAVQLWPIKLWVFNDWKLQYLFGHVTRMPCRPGAFNRMFNSPGSMELLKCCRWNRIFRSFQWKWEKRNTSEGIPLFSKNFWRKSMFHLIYHKNNWFFHTKGKHPTIIILVPVGKGNCELCVSLPAV